jgi:hypothetical protein
LKTLPVSSSVLVFKNSDPLIHRPGLPTLMPAVTLDYHTLDTLRRDHPAWRLLRADHAPLVISVLYRHFVLPNVRTFAREDLIARVDDELFHLREQLGPDTFPRTAAQYLDEWAADDKGWLRKYYVPGTDDPHFDITPATERVIDWLAQLQVRHFVGTESRLFTVFELLRQMTQGSELNPDARVADLERRKAEIDAQIQRIRDGQGLLLDSTQVRERFLQMAATARSILSDFRDVDQNFRDLDRTVRERIATSEDARGALLDGIFTDRDTIENSDQGRSFRAFWDFLMSTERQEELSSLLSAAMALEPVQSLAPDPRLLRIHFDWLQAGEVAQRTVARLSQQLRRYLDDQAILENRRILQIIRQIEQHAIAMRDAFPAGPPADLDETAPVLNLPFERPLYSPPFKPAIEDAHVVLGSEDISAAALFEQVYVDKGRLAGNVRRALQTHDQTTLAEIIAAHPLERGLAELVAYLSLAADDRQAMIDDAHAETIAWTDATGTVRQATLPQVIFTRPAPETNDYRQPTTRLSSGSDSKLMKLPLEADTEEFGV